MDLKSKLSSLASGKGLWIAVAAFALGLLLMIFGGSETAEAKKGSEISVERYAAALEADIAALCESVSGVSRVTVAVSLSGGIEYVYATDSKGDPVTLGGSSGGGLIVREKLPEIAGVGVVCRGGGDPEIQRRLISLIGAAYGVASNRIFITEAQ